MNCEGKGKMEGKNSFLKFFCETCLEATFCEVIKLNLKLLAISNHVTTTATADQRCDLLNVEKPIVPLRQRQIG